MKEHEKKAYLIAQGCNAVDKYGVPEPETLAAMQEYSDQQNAELLAWKESAMRELNALDLQSLGRKLGIGLGQSVSENLHAKVDGLLERVKELEFGAQVDSDCIESQSNEIDELKAWKQSAMAEAEKLDIQAIGKELGCSLGSSIPEQVLPGIRALKIKDVTYCNHHHPLTKDHKWVDFGDGKFVANKLAIPLLEAMNNMGLRTRTHHIDDGPHAFVSILLDNVSLEVVRVNEKDAGRTKYNGKMELLIRWQK